MKTQKNNPNPSSKRESYEAPKATRVQVRAQSGLRGCTFSSIQVCGLTE